MTPDIDGVLNQADGSRRDFLRKLIAGTVFTPPLLASFSLDGLSLTAAEALVSNQCFFVGNQTNTTCFTDVCFDFSGTQYQDNFSDILLPAGINAGADLGGTGHPALNITGHTGSGGSTWATVLNQGPIPIEIFFGLSLSADILIHRFDNSKGVGLLALAFALTGGKGLGLVVSNAGNTDRLQLMTVDTAGKVVPLKNVSLGAGVAEDAWYRLTMQIQLGFSKKLVEGSDCTVHVTGRVFRHTDPDDPDSPLGLQVGVALDFQDTLTLTTPSGDVGIVARAVSAFVDSSVTNFCVNCNGVS
jgi:hypothetical protein